MTNERRRSFVYFGRRFVSNDRIIFDGVLCFLETKSIIDTISSLMVVLLTPKPDPLAEIFMYLSTADFVKD